MLTCLYSVSWLVPSLLRATDRTSRDRFESKWNVLSGVQIVAKNKKLAVVVLGGAKHRRYGSCKNARRCPCSESKLTFIAHLQTAVSVKAQIVSCDGCNADVLKALHQDPNCQGGIQYAFGWERVDVQNLVCGPSYDAQGGIDMFSFLQTLIGRLTCLLHGRLMHSATYLEQVVQPYCQDLVVFCWLQLNDHVFLKDCRRTDHQFCGLPYASWGNVHLLESRYGFPVIDSSPSRLSECHRKGILLVFLLYLVCWFFYVSLW